MLDAKEVLSSGYIGAEVNEDEINAQMRKRGRMPFCHCVVVLMPPLQFPHPPPSALTSFYSPSIGHISYYTLPLTYTSSCSSTQARQTETHTAAI